MLYVSVVSAAGQPLMPCRPERARELVRAGKAVRRFRRGVFYLKLTERKKGDIQPVTVGIDPGSKKEGFTVMSAKRTFLNLQNDAVTHVKDALEGRRIMRRLRRQRKTPCRKRRSHRKGRTFSPGVRARWGLKLNISRVLAKLYPISEFSVEDISATTRRGQKKWNKFFGPLQMGKTWFYAELRKIASVNTRKGYETKEIRDKLGLKKSKDKLSDNFDAHCVDSWCLAWASLASPKQSRPDNIRVLIVKQNVINRRQLHMKMPAKNGTRRRYGGTRVLGFKKGSLVKHKDQGVCIMGGYTGNKVRLNDKRFGNRLKNGTRYNPEDCEFLAYNPWIVRMN